MVYTCHICNKNIKRKENLVTHYKKFHPNINLNEIRFIKNDTDNFELTCQHCGKIFTRPFNLKRHLANRCKSTEKNENRRIREEVEYLRNKVTEYCDKVDNLKPTINYLNINCVGNNDNYYDLLATETEEQLVLTYIKDCALARLTGDCKLLGRIYFNPENRPEDNAIKYEKMGGKNKCVRTNIIFRERGTNQIIYDKGGTLLGTRLASNLKNTYLTMINKNDKLKKEGKKPIFESYDESECMDHIYQLSDKTYTQKLIKNLEIPANN